MPLLALYVANGKITMSLGQNRIIQHKQKSNDGNWHRVSPALLVTVELYVVAQHNENHLKFAAILGLQLHGQE